MQDHHWNGTKRNNGNRSNASVTFSHEELVPLKGGPLVVHPIVENHSLSSSASNSNSNKRMRSFRERCTIIGAIVAACAALVLCSGVLISNAMLQRSTAVKNDDQNVQHHSDSTNKYIKSRLNRNNNNNYALLYDGLGRFILHDYDAQPPFADFLPALAGYYGKPLFAFFVNRGQAVASFGVESKDYAMLEFNSANKAYQTTPLVGFRTFLQVATPRSRQTRQQKRQSKQNDPPPPMKLIEPFSASTTRYQQLPSESERPKRTMYVGFNDVQIQEVDHVHGIETNVTFFILPEEDFGSFVKRTTITNLDARLPLTFSLVDGLAKMEPAGGRLDTYFKNMGRTLEAWMGVHQPYNDTTSMPFFRLSMLPVDSASVTVQTAGHWCLSVREGEDTGYTPDNDFLPILYDINKIFGDDTTLMTPLNLYSKSISDILKEPQFGLAKTPSAFAALETTTLLPGQSITISTFFGKADDILQVPVILRSLTAPGWVEYKLERSREVVNQILTTVKTETADKMFNLHVQQVFLDNSLRGGIPCVLGEVDDNSRMMNADEDDRLKVFHLFSRIHGDLERDYNAFVISPTFFSEGPGNFRDVVQNRRSDVIFNPRMGDFNVRMFLSFIQADGYEPLRVEAIVFTISDYETCQTLAQNAVGEADGHRAKREALTGILNRGPFRPGQLFLLIEEQHIDLVISKQDFIDSVLAEADYSPMATYETGFWADHFTYYMDLMENYLSIFPEREAKLLFDSRLPYYYSPAFVRPRRDKYVLSLTYDGVSRHIRQLDAVVVDKEKNHYNHKYILKETGWYNMQAIWQHDASGDIFRSSPFAKFLLLATVKFASRDAYGMGIEYEGGKPGWNDANNGLVGMLGSGMPELFELIVILKYLITSIERHERSVDIPVELFDLIKVVRTALATATENYKDPEELSARVPDALFLYWDTVATARELFREKTMTTFAGDTITLSPQVISSTLREWVAACESGIDRSLRFGTQGVGDNGKMGIVPTYFSYNVTRWTKTGHTNEDGHPLVIANEMVVQLFPLFLEGPTRMMKVVGSTHAARIYNSVRVSPLRDQALNMYTISASLTGQSVDMGREMAFAPGWLENQSVWLHMSYKFYLEMLRNGLYKEFFEEMRTGMLPFMDPNVYGRSLLECSSFIASSAFEDPSLHGRGFLARLSGSTAEFLSIWSLMMIGPRPFVIDEKTGDLYMQLRPALPHWLFQSSKDRPTPTPPYVAFKLFGAIEVTYYNLKKDEEGGGGVADLFGVLPSRYVIQFLDGSTYDINGPRIPFELADKIRRVVFVASIDAYFQ